MSRSTTDPKPTTTSRAESRPREPINRHPQSRRSDAGNVLRSVWNSTARKGASAAMRVALFVLAMGLAAPAPPAAADQAAWEQWQHIVGVVDVGARADGSLVVMANGHLY